MRWWREEVEVEVVVVAVGGARMGSWAAGRASIRRAHGTTIRAIDSRTVGAPAGTGNHRESAS
jgi:hypothetical protein